MPSNRHQALRRAPHETPLTEDLPRLNAPNFYYTLEDILFEETSNKETLTWSKNRSDVIFRVFSLQQDDHYRNPLRLRGRIGAPCLGGGRPAREERTVQRCKGDVFKWKHMWRVLAEQFNMEYVEFAPRLGCGGLLMLCSASGIV
ncbi:hypothetical protein RJ639_011666 [Escallonia herrerae]|uniref:Uncharacterized protein n=1 Tax=Escallonia herrerae TaxID=1293975 RepID=A0AA89ATX6_9ASTE|nr:hypothetical protein RJ639_011666 [Escallonia herrerae]